MIGLAASPDGKLAGSCGTPAGLGQPPAGSGGAQARSENRCREYLFGIEARDPDALARLYDETSGMLFGIAVRLLDSGADAEEVVLDVYKQVWKSAGAFDDSRGNVLCWLSVLTRSRAIDRLRQTGSRAVRERPIEDLGQARSPNPAPEVESMLREERRIIRRALEELMPQQREAIELAFFQGLTHFEVAERLGAPLGTIKTRIRTGMRLLRESLAPLCFSVCTGK